MSDTRHTGHHAGPNHPPLGEIALGVHAEACAHEPGWRCAPGWRAARSSRGSNSSSRKGAPRAFGRLSRQASGAAAQPMRPAKSVFEHAFLAACAAPNYEAIDVALGSGMHLNVLDKHGRGALHKLAAVATLDAGRAAARLCEAGVEICAPDRSGVTPAHVAAECDSIAVLAVLIDAGADLERRDTLGLHALHRAALSPGGQCVPTLLAAMLTGCVNDSDAEGRTPLDLAVIGGNDDLICFLCVAARARARSHPAHRLVRRAARRRPVSARALTGTRAPPRDGARLRRAGSSTVPCGGTRRHRCRGVTTGAMMTSLSAWRRVPATAGPAAGL